MTQQHPITPPPELVEQWVNNLAPKGMLSFANQAARWGSDQELEACCEWLDSKGSPNASRLRAARRPKPPSLKEEALQALAHLENGAHCSMDTTESAHYIRRALESLPD